MAVHGRFRKACPRCGERIERIRYAANETNYCPRCQTGGKVLADRALSRLKITRGALQPAVILSVAPQARSRRTQGYPLLQMGGIGCGDSIESGTLHVLPLVFTSNFAESATGSWG